ncbi:hypothetical protein [Microbulbifer sp.]|uniref:hypothetical protein n=1 Tax=Microbulbifer sp. TaxID=1908541 RepID=UPI002F931544
MPPDEEPELPPEEEELLEELELELPPEELLLEELEPPEDELEELLDEPNAGGLVSEPLEPPPQAVNNTDTAIAAIAVTSFCCMVYL